MGRRGTSVKATERILEKMEKLQADHDVWAEHQLTTARDLGPMFHGQPNAAQVHQLVVDGRVAEAQAKIDQAGRVLDQDIADLREQARAALDVARHAAEVADYQAIQANAPSGVQWQEAEARRVFVQEDISRQDTPDDVVGLWTLASDAGDTVAAWLYARYGLAHLHTVIDTTDNIGEAARARLAYDQLAGAVYGDARQAQRETARALDDLARRVAAPLTYGERLRQAEQAYGSGTWGQTPEQLVELGILDTTAFPWDGTSSRPEPPRTE